MTDSPSGATAPLRVRPMVAADHPAVLAMNEASVQHLSPMDAARLEWILARASTPLVVEDDEGPLGFAIAIAAGTDYDGSYYARFGELYDDFLYLDRIAVNERARRRGVGNLLYATAEAAAGPHGRMLCEVNVRPRNEPSLAFHASRGYVPVEERPAPGEPGKAVVMLAKELAD